MSEIIEKYVWESSSDTCDKCQELDGKEFKTADEIPDRPHPNCDCVIKEVNGELCDCAEQFEKIEEITGAAADLQDEIKEEVSEIEDLKNEAQNIDFNLADQAQNLINYLSTLSGVLQDFISNYIKLLEAGKQVGWQNGMDDYYHFKANCQAAQRGELGVELAEALSQHKENFDSFSYALSVKLGIEKDLKDKLRDREKDEKSNREGREAGKNYPNGCCGTLGEKYRPNNLPKKYW